MSEMFISYARKDGLEFAEQLERALPNTWRDKRGIDPTNDFTNEIEQAMRGAVPHARYPARKQLRAP